MAKKMGLPIAEGVAIVALIVGLFAKGNLDQTTIAQKENEIQEVQTQLQAKDEEIASLGTMSEEFAALQEEVAKLETANGELTAAVETAESERDALMAAATEAGVDAEAVVEEVAAALGVENADAETAAEEAGEAAADEATDDEVTEETAATEATEDQSAALAAKDDELAAKDTALAEKDSALAEKDSALAEMDTALAEKDSLIADQEAALAEKDSELAAKDEDFKAKEQQYQEQAAALQDQIAEILGIRGQIIDRLQDIFTETEIPVAVNEDNGIITLDSSILFEYDSAELTKEGMKLLDEVLPKYVGVVFGDEAKGYVSEMIIEGHTDDKGSYLYNLSLSQRRAYAVANYCLDEDCHILTDAQKEELGKALTANGKSFSVPVVNEDGSVNAEKSRRVEIKFRLLSDELLTQVSE